MTLLAIDVGNTQTVLGIFGEEGLDQTWRISTREDRTRDEYTQVLSAFLAEVDLDLSSLVAVVIGSVVPAVTRELVHLPEVAAVRVIDDRGPFSFTVDVPAPWSVGTDRLLNAEAALNKYGPPLVIADVGTATTVCAVTSDSRYVGGAIAPGPGVSLSALTRKAARLGAVDIHCPERVIGATTAEALRSGIVHGTASLIDGLVERIVAELDEPGVRVIGTGGWMPMIAPACRRLDAVDPDLTLHGLYQVWENGR